MPGERIAVARIVRAHGLKGELILQSLSDVRQWKRGEVYHISFDTPPRNITLPEQLTLMSAVPHGDNLRIRCREVSDRTLAERLTGAFLEVEERPPTGKWLFYNDELIGMTIVDARGTVIGSVIDVYDLPGSHALEVKQGENEAAIVPFLKRFVKDVNRETKTIVYKPIPGMFPWHDGH